MGLGVYGPPDIHLRVRRDANQTITNNTDTLIAWDTVIFDTAGMIDLSVSSSIITIPVDGHYQVFYTLEWDAESAGERRSWFLDTGATTEFGADTRDGAGGARPTNVQVMCYPRFIAEGQWQLWVWQNRGGNLALVSHSGNSLHLDITLIRPGIE